MLLSQVCWKWCCGRLLFVTGVMVGLLLASRADAQVAFKDVHVIPMTDTTVLEHQTVLVKDHQIESISDANTTRIPDGYTTVDGEGTAYLMPGMMNAHAHLPGPQGLEMPLRDYMLMQVAAGVTSLRVMRYEEDHLALRKQTVDEAWVAPRLYLTAPAIRKDDGIDYVSGPESLLTSYQKLGYDHIKYLNGLDSATHEVLVVAANRVGLPFAGHLPPHIDLQNTIRARQRGIEHFHGYTKLLIDQELDELKTLIRESEQNRVFNCPTADWYHVQKRLPATLLDRKGLEFLPVALVDSWKLWLQEAQAKEPNLTNGREVLLKMFAAAGAQHMLLGWDDGRFMIPGFGVTSEMEHFSRAGFSHADILKFVTVNGAAFYDAGDQFGSLQPGLRADAVLLGSNPLDDLDALNRIQGVMVNGKWYSQEFLAQSLAKLKPSVAMAGPQ